MSEITMSKGNNSIGYLEDSARAEKAAKEQFKAMELTGNYPNIRLVMSNHWASEGWWIEWGELSRLSDQDIVVSKSELDKIITPM